MSKKPFHKILSDIRKKKTETVKVVLLKDINSILSESKGTTAGTIMEMTKTNAEKFVAIGDARYASEEDVREEPAPPEPIDEKEILDKTKTDIILLLLHNKRREASERIVKYTLTRHHIYTIRDDEQAEMWIYADGIYKPEAKTYIKEICRRILGDAYTTQVGNEVIAKIEADTYIAQEDFFKNERLDEVAVENGILNIKTRHLSDFTPEKHFFTKIPVKFDSTADCPNILTHFQTVLKNEGDVPVMMELIGYLLLREYRIEKAVMLIGGGRNGKSKTLELIKNFIGMDNVVNVSLTKLENEEFSSQLLFNKHVNISMEIDAESLKKTGMFKSVTGRDLITSNRKFKTHIHFVNYAKMIFATNNLPRTLDISDAFWNRWIILEFPYTFISQKEIDVLKEGELVNVKLKDDEIVSKLTTPEELSGLLNAGLDGLDRLLKQGDFSYSKTTTEVKEMWIRKSDSFAAFLMDCVEENYDSRISKQDLRQQYHIYCRQHKLLAVGDKWIKEKLCSSLGIGEEIGSDSKRTAFWVGISFKNRCNVEGVEDVDSILTYTKKSLFLLGVKDPPQPLHPLHDHLLQNTFEKVYDIVNTSGNGVIIESLLLHPELENLPSEEVYQAVRELKEKGRIYEPKIGLLFPTHKQIETK